MPRKYRPPASSKRRKAKQIDYDFPTPDQTGSDIAVAEGDADTDAAEPASFRVSRETVAERSERHVRRDYSYVRSEAVRIAVIGGSLLAAIVVAGFFR